MCHSLSPASCRLQAPKVGFTGSVDLFLQPLKHLKLQHHSLQKPAAAAMSEPANMDDSPPPDQPDLLRYVFPLVHRQS
jgi:hypothetical protein